MRAARFLFVLALVLGAASASSRAQRGPQDYPQWRGPHRDGSASAFIEPSSWPNSLTRRWRVEVGEGYATPLVIGDTVYVFTRRGENEGLAALDARAGAERWRSDYPLSYTPSPLTVKHGAGPKATPLFHEGKLFVLGITGIVSAFDASTGTRLWQSPPPAEVPYFSAASSLLGEGGLVIGHPGNYGPLTAFDSNTGEIKWSAGSGGFFSSPIAADLTGTRQVITATQDSVIGVSLDGRVLWRYPWNGGNGSTTPVLNGETIIVGGSNGVSAFRPVLRQGSWSTEALWESKDVSTYLANPVVANVTVFGLSTRQRGQFFALDAATGALRWLGEPREAENTAIVKSGSLLFLLNDDGELIVAKASVTAFEPIARYMVADTATWAQPAISGNRIFIKDVNSLTLWTVD